MLQTSQVLFRVYALARGMVLPFKDSKARPLEPRCATPSATKLPDTLAGLRRGLASVGFGTTPKPANADAIQSFLIFASWELGQSLKH